MYSTVHAHFVKGEFILSWRTERSRKKGEREREKSINQASTFFSKTINICANRSVDMLMVVLVIGCQTTMLARRSSSSKVKGARVSHRHMPIGRLLLSRLYDVVYVHCTTQRQRRWSFVRADTIKRPFFSLLSLVSFCFRMYFFICERRWTNAEINHNYMKSSLLLSSWK